MQLSTKHIRIETGFGLLAATIALSGAAIIPRWNPMIEYCVPGTACHIHKQVDPELFQWHQVQAKINADKLREKRKHKHRHFLEENLQDATDNFGDFTVGFAHTFAPKSSKEFLSLSAEARHQGWKLQAVQELPGYANWRKFAGGLSLLAVGGLAWSVGQLEVLQPKRDRREEIDEEFYIERHRKALEGEHSVIRAEIDWVSAAGHKELQAVYLGDDYDEMVQQEARELDERIAKQEAMQLQLTGTQTLDSINDPSDKLDGNGGAGILDGSSEKIGLEILDGLVGSRRSTLLVGGTGAGKSVTQAYILTNFFKRYPDAEVWALAQKNDSFCGLDRKKRVVLFDTFDPEPAIALIDHIHGIYDKRRKLPEHARVNLAPVRLILADWLSINKALETNKGDATIRGSKYLSKLTDIIFNGRELNCCLLVDLQSFNLAAIGLSADRNGRKNFNLVGLGNYSTDEFGSINESYGVLSNMIGDQNMVAEERERAMLKDEYKRLLPVSKSNQRPIIFTTLEPARVALLPNLMRYKVSSAAPSPEQPNPISASSPEYLNKILELEFDVKGDAWSSDRTAELSKDAKKVLSIIKNATKYPMAFSAIQNSRQWDNNKPKVEELKKFLYELLEVNKIKGDDKSGYAPRSPS